MSEYVCQECREPVDPEASRCPHCSYDAADGENHMKRYRKNKRLGGLISLTLIGLPVGLLLFLQAQHHKKKAENATVAVEAVAARDPTARVARGG